MLGDTALKLIVEARNVEATGSLKPYNDELTRLLLLETRQLQSEISLLLSSIPGGPSAYASAAEADPRLAAQLLAHHAASQRNKRCLLAYHHSRCQWLKNRLWEKGGSVALVLEEQDSSATATNSTTSTSSSSSSSSSSTAAAAGDLRSKLSPAELTWLRNYASLITAYKSEFLDILDVAAPLHTTGTGNGTLAQINGYKPPEDLMVTVVVMRDAKGVMTEMGQLNLRRGERMRVRRTEVEGLIIRGWVQVMDD